MGKRTHQEIENDDIGIRTRMNPEVVMLGGNSWWIFITLDFRDIKTEYK